MPIMLQSALMSNMFIASQMLASCFPSNIFVKILGNLRGMWATFFSVQLIAEVMFSVFIFFQPLEDSPQLRATSGIT